MNVVEVTDSLLDSLVVNISTVRVHDPFRDRATELINKFRTTQWQEMEHNPIDHKLCF
jgi:hypothetical protein